MVALNCVSGLRKLENFFFLRCILVFDSRKVVVIDACNWKTVTSKMPRRQLKVATWNIPGLSKVEKRQQVVEYLHNRKIDICALQETKMKFQEMQTIGEYDLIFLGKKNPGMGFIVRNEFIYKTVDDKNKRICVIEIEKKSEFAPKIMHELKAKLFKINKKKNTLIVVNVHAPHMGYQESDTEQFFEEMENTTAKIRGYDLMIVCDFKAKVGRKKLNDGESIGEHSGGIQNVNGQALVELCSKMKLLVVNTFFKHKASLITTWESKRNNVKIFNQIDYVITRGGMIWSLEDARSYKAMEISTDHRLVMDKFDGDFFKRRQNHANLAVVTAKMTGHGNNSDIEESAMKEERDRLSKEQKEAFAKIKQSNKETNRKKTKKKNETI